METENKYLNIVKWIALVLVLFYTSLSTWQLVALISGHMEGLPLTIRQVVAVALTDGGVILWHALGNRYKSEGQRNTAAFMQWTCFAILGAFFVASAVFGIIEPSTPVEIAAGWTMSLAECVGYVVLAAMGVILFGTPAAFFAIEMQSPEHRMTIEATKARQVLDDRLVSDFKTGQAAVMNVLSANGAIERLKREMVATGYSEAEATILAEVARAGIERSKPPVTLNVAGGTSQTASFFGLPAQVTPKEMGVKEFVTPAPAPVRAKRKA